MFRHPEELAPMTVNPILSARGVRKTFEADLAPVRALRGADLDVVKGEFIAIMGPSGCGKSTLLNLIAGLDAADEGEIVLAGQTITGRDEDWLARMRRRDIGMVFQFFNLLEGMTVLENVALPAIIAGKRRKAAEAQARDLLDLLGLGDKMNEVPAVLSGGQRQRLAIARALANQPTLLLADEPTARWTVTGAEKFSNSSAGCMPTARPYSWSPTAPRWRPEPAAPCTCATVVSRTRGRRVVKRAWDPLWVSRRSWSVPRTSVGRTTGRLAGRDRADASVVYE